MDDTTQTVTVVASATLRTAFMKIMRVEQIPVRAEAAARVKPGSGPPVCLHSLSATGTALTATGRFVINAAPCITWFNSSSASSISMIGGASITGQRNCVAAGTPTGFTPAAERCSARADPYAGTSPALPAGLPTCGPTNITGSAAARLTECIYTGSINITGSGALTFEPGVYVIRGGALNITMSGGSVTANGVVFVLENGASVNLTSSGTTYNLTGRTSGDFAGFIFYQRTGTTGDFSITGTNSFYFEGAFYLPSHTMTITGTNTATTTSPFTAIIANDFSLTGTSTWTFAYDPPRVTVPVPGKLLTGRGVVALVR